MSATQSSMSEPVMDANPLRLIADIGGTNARFALLAADGSMHHLCVLAAKDFPNISDALKHYLSQAGNPKVEEAALAIANPIVGDQIDVTNNHWSFSIKETQRELGFKRMIFKNDFTALAMSIPSLPAQDLVQIGGVANVKDSGSIAVIGPGTGLGVSGLIPLGDHWVPLEGEGGHVTISPANDREYAIVKACRQHYSHISAERLISGMGLQNLYKAICQLENVAAEDLAPADISELGCRGENPHCAEALAIFCGLLGSVAGDLVLTLGAFRGVYIGGGIVPQLGEYFAASNFRARFEAKGRFEKHLQQVPAFVITTQNPALFGIGEAFSL